jgi:hypothetical protein
MVASTVEAPVQPVQRMNGTIPIRIRTQIKTLYLVNGLSPVEIEAMGLGVTRQTVSNLASREGWTKKRKEVLAKVETSVDARTDAAAQAVSEALALESEELCFKALDQTRAGLTEGGLNGAKQAQAASSTLKNLATTARMLREPAGTPTGEGSTVNLNLFFSPTPKAEPKQVTEIVSTNV